MPQNLLNVTDLDFDQIKSNLKAYFKTQADPQFRDWDFDGSGLSMLLDVLAYNTHYNAILAHMNVNESFIDTAQLRSSVISQAKLLGYLPGSIAAARATIEMTCVANDPQTQTKLTIPRGTKFVSNTPTGSYTFVSLSDVTAQPSNGIYTFAGTTAITVAQGTLNELTYLVDASISVQKFMVDDDGADITTLIVSIFDHENSTNSTTFSPYFRFNSSPDTALGTIDGTSQVYFISQSTQGKYEVTFGDGVVGKALNNLQVVKLSFVSTQGSLGNGATSYSFADTTPVDNAGVITSGIPKILATSTISAGGADPESTDKIRVNAPNSLVTQNRAVTANDYVSLLLQNFGSQIRAINVWGGESETVYDPLNAAKYAGNVYISIAPTGTGSSMLTDAQKTAINTFLDSKRVMTVKTNFYDPDYINVYLNLAFKYNPNKTSLTLPTLNTNVSNVISSYNASSLQNFTGVFRYSNLMTSIDQSDPSILNANAQVYFYKQYTVPAFSASSDVIVSYATTPNGLITTFGNQLFGSVNQSLPMVTSSPGFTLTPCRPDQNPVTVIGSFSNNTTSNIVIKSSPSSNPNPYLVVGATITGTGISTSTVSISTIDNKTGTYSIITLSTPTVSTQSNSTLTISPPTGTYYLKDGPDATSTTSRRLFMSTISSSTIAVSDPKVSSSGRDIYIGTVYPATGKIELHTYRYSTVSSASSAALITDTTLSTALTDQYAGSLFYVVSGTSAGQWARVSSNSGVTLNLTGGTLVTTPDASSQYVLINSTIDANVVPPEEIKIFSRPASLDVAPSRHQIVRIDSNLTPVAGSVDTIAVSGVTGTNNYSTFSQ